MNWLPSWLPFTMPDPVKIIIVSVAIPTIQSISNKLWQRRKPFRLAEIRKKIVDTDQFIEKETPNDKDHPEVAQAIQQARADRNELFEQHKKAATPLSQSHPRLWKFAQAILLTAPQNKLTWLSRVAFFMSLPFCINFMFERDAIHNTPFDHFMTFVAGVVFIINLYKNARSADDEKAGLTPRPLWRRITLFYLRGPLIFWVIMFYLVLFALVLTQYLEPSLSYGIFFTGAAISLWLWITHFDREQLQPPTPPT